MATSKDVLFWTPRGQLLGNKCIIPVTNIAELLEYVLLPYNDDATKPHGLNTLLDGLAELGTNKALFKNKKLLIDLIFWKSLLTLRELWCVRDIKHVVSWMLLALLKFVLYAINRSPRREITSRRAFFGVTIVEQLHTKTPRRWKPIFIPVLKKGKEAEDD